MPLAALPSDRDTDQLRLLAIFHYIYGGLHLVGLLFLFLHYSMMRMFFGNPQLMEQMRHPVNGQPMPFDPQTFFQAFIWFYIILGAIIAAMMVLNLAAAVNLQAAKSRVFVMVVGCLNCLAFPFGTALGVFTLIVLQRDSVRAKFESNSAPA